MGFVVSLLFPQCFLHNNIFELQPFMKERCGLFCLFVCKGPAVPGCFHIGTVLTTYENEKEEGEQGHRNTKYASVLENLKPCSFEGATY